MQKNVRFSKSFIQKAKKSLLKTYPYEEYMDFIVVKFFKNYLVYVPIFSYSDRENIDDLLELAKDNEYEIRVLNFEYSDFKKFDAVTMRLDVEGKNLDELMKNFHTSRRRQVRKALKKGFTYEIGGDYELIDRFYTIFSKSMHRLGTPVHKKELFYNLSDEFRDNFKCMVFYYEGEIVGGMIFFIDEEIIINEWLAVSEKYKKEYLGSFIYYKFIEESLKYNKKIIDLGRSPYESGTYNFKYRFGAYPVKIDMISSKEENIYSKFELASKIWKKLPKFVVDFVGPKIAGHLKEY